MSVGVVIPCRNAAAFVQQAVDSVLAQSMRVAQIVVVDDGSTDGTREVLSRLRDRVTVVTQDAAGGNAARNRGLEALDTKWVQFLDADDWLLPQKIEYHVELAERTDCDLVYGPVRIQRGTQPVSEERYGPTVAGPAPEHWLSYGLTQTGGILWRTQSLRDLGGWNERQPVCQDNELAMRAVLAERTTAYCSRADAVYRIWASNTVSRRDVGRTVAAKTQLIDHFAAIMRSQGRWNEQLERRYLSFGYAQVKQLLKVDWRTALDYLASRYDHGGVRVEGNAMFDQVARLIGVRAAVALFAIRKAVVHQRSVGRTAR